MTSPHRPNSRRRARSARSATCGLVLLAVAVASGPVSAQDTPPTTTALPGIDVTVPAPATTTADDGLSTTDGTRRLAVDQVRDIPVEGATLQVAGSGYDVDKGVYIAFCVLPQPGQRPTPCGGGADTDGTTGASKWVSSNPPPYGRGLAVAYGPDGSFSASIHVTPVIGPDADCTKVLCGIITRNDHVRSSDRSQDIFVPVRFAGTDPELAPPTTTSTTEPDPTATTVVVTALAPAVESTTTARGRADRDSDSDSDDGANTDLIVGAAAVAVAALAGVAALARRRRGGAS
jgi:hypothetical protein